MEKYFGKLIQDYKKLLDKEFGDEDLILKKFLIDEFKDVLEINLLENYKEILKQELGNGEASKRIYNELEKIVHGENSKDNYPEYLDKEIEKKLLELEYIIALIKSLE